MKHKNDKIEIGKKLKEARISCGLTQEEVCEQIDCAPRYVSALETNQTTGSISLILKLCSLYNISLDYLYSDYLKSESFSDDLLKINGYLKLNEYNRSIIENNIMFLNKLQSKNN